MDRPLPTWREQRREKEGKETDRVKESGRERRRGREKDREEVNTGKLHCGAKTNDITYVKLKRFFECEKAHTTHTHTHTEGLVGVSVILPDVYCLCARWKHNPSQMHSRDVSLFLQMYSITITHVQ